MKKSAGTFNGTSLRADFHEALTKAIESAKAKIPTDYVEWRLVEASGKEGGFVLVKELTVTIEVFLPA